jgi:hypothetical protein
MFILSTRSIIEHFSNDVMTENHDKIGIGVQQ